MCFANSVLQILVYCAPFHQLFVELGRVVPDPVVGKENQKEGGSSQPLVAATVAFLKEFKGKDGVVAAGARNGNGSVGRKGKEREEREEDDWDGDSFLPSYVYDAMKEKKRFDNMRVCFLSFFSGLGLT
jgi:ubiquitin carboxyl-terminal hydrolase 10